MLIQSNAFILFNLFGTTEQSATQLLFIYANICCFLLLISNWDHLTMHFSALHGSTVWKLCLSLEIQVVVVTEWITSFDVGERISSGQFSLPNATYNTHFVIYVIRSVCSLLKNEKINLFLGSIPVFGYLVSCPQHTTKMQFIMKHVITCL